MEIIPAIDLLGGNCVRLNQGDYEQVTQFNRDPVKQALHWQAQGASKLHVVDLDGAKTGEPTNDLSIRKITAALDIPVQLGGGVRTFNRAKELIDYGVERVILGTVAIENPSLVKRLSEAYPQKILIGIDAKDGRVATRGWINQSDVLATELAKTFSESEIAGIISTDISQDGTLKGPNLQAMKDIALVSQVPVIASGGVGCMSDLLSLVPLESDGVTGIIVGRAIYDGKVDLKEAIKALENSHLIDPPTKNIYA